MAFRRFRRMRHRYRVSGGARGWYTRRGGARGIAGNKWVTFGAGAAAGFLAPKVIPFQDEIALVLCAAPVKMPRMVRSVASGYVIGRIAKNLIGGGLSGQTSGGSGWY